MQPNFRYDLNQGYKQNSLEKKASEDVWEKIIELILLGCGLVSVFTTFAIVCIIFQVQYGSVKPKAW